MLASRTRAPSSNPLAELAYAVPFRVDRSRAPAYRLVNTGYEPVMGLTLSLLGSGVMTSTAPRVIDVGAAVDLTVLGEDLALRTVLVVRWFRPGGDEYLWRVSF